MLIALALVTIVIFFKQIGVEIKLEKLFKTDLKEEGFLNSSNENSNINKGVTG